MKCGSDRREALSAAGHARQPAFRPPLSRGARNRFFVLAKMLVFWNYIVYVNENYILSTF